MVSSSQPSEAVPSSPSSTPRVKTLNSAVDHSVPRLRPARSIPPWISSYEEGDGPVNSSQLRLLKPPERSVQAQHNSTPQELQHRISRDGFEDFDDPRLGPPQDTRSRIPHFLRYGRASMRGRKWDHLRSAEPVIVAGYQSTGNRTALAWHDFIRSSAWGKPPNEESEIVGHEALNQQYPNFDGPVKMSQHPIESGLSRRRRTLALYKRIWNLVLRHSLTPLISRLAVMITSILALGISARIYKLERAANDVPAEQTQSAVAVTVDTVAIPYIAYMIWDEFNGKPLGLRSGASKMSLILLDLFFIIFKSASTALVFESLVFHEVKHKGARELSAALAVIILLGLIAWTINLTVNIFRTVQRLGGADNDDDRDDSQV